MKWTPEENYFLFSLLKSDETPSYDKIADSINLKHNSGLIGFPTYRSPDAVRRRILRIRKSGQSFSEPHAIDTAWQNIIKLTKEYTPKSTFNDLGLVNSTDRKIVSFSDLHIPFFLWRNMKNALEHHNDADIVVLNGDILDAYLFSTFSKTKRIAALKEYMIAFDLVSYLSDNFENVVIVSGNHDIRTSRAAYSGNLDKEAVEIFRPDLLARIANGERLNEFCELTEKLDFSNVHYKKVDSWFFQVGKTIFCHPSGFGSAYPGATVVKLLDHFNNRLSPDEFDSIVVGHTHKVYKGVVANKLLIEQGAMCHRLPYQFKADLRFKNASNGFAIIYQNSNGETNYNDSTPVYLGTHLPNKKGSSL